MSLLPNCYQSFPVSSITPTGWLADQLSTQARGLSGQLDQFWPDISSSAWIGGSAEGWERMPYWLDGVIPLAWLLKDEQLQSRINRYLNYIIVHQQEDGWLGPRIEDKQEAADLWSQALALKMLVGYHDATADDRIAGVVERALKGVEVHIKSHPLQGWARSRWFEFLISIWWLYDQKSSQWLLELARELQRQGLDWNEVFADRPQRERTPPSRTDQETHVVNNAMAIRSGPLLWRLTQRNEDLSAAGEMIGFLDKYHGMPTGVFSGDEHLAGKSPIQGTELCAVVEYMYSLECLLGITGDVSFSDRLEKIAFNALPATFSPDMWSHQYDQQVNQVECSVCENRTWTTNRSDSNIFGLEPNFGCCTANLSQGWPKFAAHLWMRTNDGGIAALSYAPSTLSTSISGVEVHIELATEYPFKDELNFRITVDQPVKFPLHLYIPTWAKAASLNIQQQGPQPAQPGTMHVIDRIWEGDEKINLVLPMETRLVPTTANATTVQRGPLLLALPIGERWQRINETMPGRELPHGDWEVHPTTPWSYALAPEPSRDAPLCRISHQKIGRPAFSPAPPPLTASVPARRVLNWEMANGSALPIPTDLALSDEIRDITLIPYGCTNLRIAEFPTVSE